MSKVRISAFVFILLSLVLLGIKQVNADTPIPSCPNDVQTLPPILNSESSRATFTIPLGQYYDSSVKKWTVAFDCGVFQQTGADALLVSQSVTATIPRNTAPGQGCEFYAGTHNIIPKGDDIPRCKAQYTVVDSDFFCKLSLTVSNSVPINPPDGIISSSEVKVSGENLTQNGQFSLFIDNNDDLHSGNYVGTPKFSNITIDNKKLTPGNHQVYLKRRYVSFSTFQSPRGPSLCPEQFTVGTPDKPGSIIGTNPSGTFSICQINPSDPACASGGGQQIPGCGIPDTNGVPDPRGPGIPTAIGCIHTNPAEFVKDFMTWVIGISGGLAFLMMLLGAFQMLTSAGNPETLNAGRSRLTSAIIGLLLIIFAVLLFQIIGFDILKIPGFGR